MRSLLAITVSMTAAACGGSDRAAPLAEAPSSVQLTRALLTAGDVTGVPGAPAAEFDEERVNPSSLTPKPDIRGPCGAKVDQPSFERAELVSFTGPANVSLYQGAIHLPHGVAARFISAETGDVRPGCGTFTSRMPFKYAQINQFLGEIRLPDLADQRVAIVSRVRAKHHRSRWVYAAQVFIRRGEYLTFMQLASLQREPSRFVLGLAVRAAAKLDELPAA